MRLWVEWLERLVFDWVGPELEESGWSFPGRDAVHPGLLVSVRAGDWGARNPFVEFEAEVTTFEA